LNQKSPAEKSAGLFYLLSGSDLFGIRNTRDQNDVSLAQAPRCAPTVFQPLPGCAEQAGVRHKKGRYVAAFLLLTEIQIRCLK
jgi:hypothetical protein